MARATDSVLSLPVFGLQLRLLVVANVVTTLETHNILRVEEEVGRKAKMEWQDKCRKWWLRSGVGES